MAEGKQTTFNIAAEAHLQSGTCEVSSDGKKIYRNLGTKKTVLCLLLTNQILLASIYSQLAISIKVGAAGEVS